STTINIEAPGATNTPQLVGVNLYITPALIQFTIYSPVDIVVTDPDGLSISKDLNEIPGAGYAEIDLNGDGDPDDQVTIPDRKPGDYMITVIPEPGASPTDTYTLEVTLGDEATVLAEHVQISAIPDEPYLIESTETGINAAPVADAGPDQTAEVGEIVTLNGSGSYDPDGNDLTYEWAWLGGSASGAGPTVVFPVGTTAVTLTVSDGQLSDSDTVDITVVDTTPPEVQIEVPLANAALQDGVTLTASASDLSGVSEVYFHVREPDGGQGSPIGYEDLVATLQDGNPEDGTWQFGFNTLDLEDGYYVILAKAVDSYGNEGWSEVVPFSIRNWAVLELLPASESNKAGRTMPVKFSLRIAESVDPAQPFVYNEELEIRIYDAIDPGNVLQTSTYGDTARDYRIDSTVELCITNFKTAKEPAEYVVVIWIISKNFQVGSFTFETVK
ncbi:MAG: PKD domain-containing protein, partial [Dehalococcoidia bacterium]